jgi:hypothetical protein
MSADSNDGLSPDPDATGPVRWNPGLADNELVDTDVNRLGVPQAKPGELILLESVRFAQGPAGALAAEGCELIAGNSLSAGIWTEDAAISRGLGLVRASVGSGLMRGDIWILLLDGDKEGRCNGGEEEGDGSTDENGEPSLRQYGDDDEDCTSSKSPSNISSSSSWPLPLRPSTSSRLNISTYSTASISSNPSLFNSLLCSLSRP